MRISARAWIVLVGVALAAVPFAKPPAFYESFLYLVFHWIVLATSWNILSGYSGYFSFGHGAFFGAGMYATATLAGTFGVPFLWTLPIAALASALFGMGIGAVVFRVGRLRGELFALLTLAVTFVLATVVLNTPLDGGQGVNLGGVPLPALMAVAVVHVLRARAGPGAGHRVDRLRDLPLAPRSRAVRHPRRRGRRRGDGRADVPLQDRGLRRVLRARRGRGRHPRDVRLLRDGRARRFRSSCR